MAQAKAAPKKAPPKKKPKISKVKPSPYKIPENDRVLGQWGKDMARWAKQIHEHIMSGGGDPTPPDPPPPPPFLD